MLYMLFLGVTHAYRASKFGKDYNLTEDSLDAGDFRFEVPSINA